MHISFKLESYEYNRKLYIYERPDNTRRWSKSSESETLRWDKEYIGTAWFNELLWSTDRNS